MATPNVKWEPSVLQLNGDNNDLQNLAQRYADGFILVQIVTFFRGRTLAFLHRPVDEKADFTPRNAPSEAKSLPPITPISQPFNGAPKKQVAGARK